MTTPIASRRSFITGLISLVAAPAIVRAGSLMPVRQMIVSRDTLNFVERLWVASDSSMMEAALLKRIEQARMWRSSFDADLLECRRFIVGAGSSQ